MEQERLIANRTGTYRAPYGRSFFYMICPWCGARTRCIAWSFASVGKKCPKCGALHQPSGYSKRGEER